MTDYKLVPVEPTQEMIAALKDRIGVTHRGGLLNAGNALANAIAAAPAVQGEPVGEVRFELGAPSVVYGELYNEAAPHLVPGTLLYAAPQPAPDVAGLVEALESALFGTPLDDVSNRDNDDIWCLCYPHLPERASDALRDHLVRIEIALAAYRKGGDES